MARTIDEIMTHDPRTIESGSSVRDAARIMARADIGDVIVIEGGEVAGIVTDRDIVVRIVAEGGDPDSTSVGEACTTGISTLTPDQSIDDAIRMMREHDIRRIPVVKDGRPVGIVSIGDLAVERDTDSALADISASDPNN